MIFNSKRPGQSLFSRKGKGATAPKRRGKGGWCRKKETAKKVRKISRDGRMPSANEPLGHKNLTQVLRRKNHGLRSSKGSNVGGDSARKGKQLRNLLGGRRRTRDEDSVGALGPWSGKKWHSGGGDALFRKKGRGGFAKNWKPEKIGKDLLIAQLRVSKVGGG